MDLYTTLSNKVLDLESEVLDIKSTYKAKIEKLESRVKRLEEENRLSKELKGIHFIVDFDEPVMEKEESSKQGKKIADIDVLSMLDVNDEEPNGVEEVVELFTAAKLITEVVTTAGVDVNASSVQDTPIIATKATKVIVKVPKPRKRKGVIIQDPEETTTTVIVQPKNSVIEQVKRNERLTDAVIKYQALKRKPLTEAQARRNMIVYLKNMAGYKMNYFKGMSYDEIRPIFEKHYNYNQAFLNEVNEGIKVSKKEVRQEKEVEVESSKREGESLEQEIAKKQKMDQETKELKKRLQIVPDDDDDDDVYTDATPLASKIPIVDYQIYTERNRPYFKIIRADGNHKFFMIFKTMMKNFDREDFESLWKIIRERFEKTKPKNYKDDYLLNTLKILFKKPNVEANVWKDQKGKYGLAKVKSWKLFDSCRVHCLNVSTTQIFLLVEKMYPLTHFTPEQMVNDVRLEVYDESYLQNSKAYIILNKHTKKVEESLNATFDETPPLSKTSPLVDDELDEKEAIKFTEKKNLENDIEVETLEIDEIVNIKESRNHPLENVIGNLNQRTLSSQAQNQITMQEKLNQFIAKDVWELVPQPRNMKIIGTKWLVRNNLGENGVVSRNKARPDIMFSVCLCARFQEAPKTSHIEVVKRIFRYIKGTTHLGLWYPKGTDIETIVYADSDHAGDYMDRKITSGIYTFMQCCLTSWFSKKQTVLAISTIEAEYVSAEKACELTIALVKANQHMFVEGNLALTVEGELTKFLASQINTFLCNANYQVSLQGELTSFFAREHKRMILESVGNGPLIWPTVEENRVTRTKKNVELSAAEKIQADCDMKATNIILQGLPADIYLFVNHHKVAKVFVESSITNASLLYEWSKFMTDVKLVKDLHTTNFDQLHAYLKQHELYANEVYLLRDDLIACLNKEMTFLTAIASSRFPSINNQLRTSSNPRNHATIQDGRVTAQQVQGRQGESYSDLGVLDCQAVQTIIPNNVAFQTEDFDTYDSDCDDISNEKTILMANISNYGLYII
nr:retrovirus-related Pol polyprotein from transposon TNT 1-94 [Tanacetum cinerariifolium]